MGLFSKKRTSQYDGWSNRQTWMVSAWINNDEMFYEVLMQAYQLRGSIVDQARWLDRQVSGLMHRQVECSGLFLDLVEDAYAKINWVEIIRSNKE